LIHRYHDGTKHSFQRFARSLGYLDWASQPNPFRSFAGAPVTALSPRPDALPSLLGTVLRHALGLTAWKQHGQSRWSLRANPSSGNLHPTEAYLVCSVGQRTTISHYAPDRHALELRCVCDAELPDAVVLVALTSIHWRESWKYGERAFRYCQHDLGHAIAAIRFAVSLVGWTAWLSSEWSHADIAMLTGVDRDEDYVEAEREEAGCLIVVSRKSKVESQESEVAPRKSILDGVRRGQWYGRANQLSEDHVQWTFIDEIAAATRDPGSIRPDLADAPDHSDRSGPLAAHILQRRSAVAFDGQSALHVDRAIAMLKATLPDGSPFDALWWSARIHLALFVHRVDGLEPGLYLMPREAESGARLKGALRPDFLYEPASDRIPLFRLTRGDCRVLARRLSCDQDIAADGFFSLGMIADFDRSLDQYGPSFYRRLFWESGVVGQVLYVEAEAAGVRATGIGCFYDDPVHDVLGLTGHAFQSLYHFTVGVPVEDKRLTTEPGYSWELFSPQ
jgi:nitroreductase